MKGFAPGLVLKQRHKETRKRPIGYCCSGRARRTVNEKHARGLGATKFVRCLLVFVCFVTTERLVPKSAIFGDIWKAENKNHSSSRRSIPLNQV